MSNLNNNKVYKIKVYIFLKDIYKIRLFKKRINFIFIFKKRNLKIEFHQIFIRIQIQIKLNICEYSIEQKVKK